MWLSLAGVLFSGYISYKEIFGNLCNIYVCSEIAGLPVCVYGMAIFIVLLVSSICGLRANK